MRECVQYSVESDDGRSLSFDKKEVRSYCFHYTFRFSHIMVIAFIIGFILTGKAVLHNRDDLNTDISQIHEEPPTIQEAEQFIDSNGFVFANSSDRFLTEEEVLCLLDDETIGFPRLIRMAINEIYARHGNVFRAGEENDVFYRQFDWYSLTDKHVVGWEEFNEIEKINLGLLISIENEYGN